MKKELPSPAILGVIPNQDELDRLVENYPSYELPHRDALLNGYFQGRTLEQIVDAKLAAKGLKRNECSPRSLGGHTSWAYKKIYKTIMRIRYLRYRIDDGLTRIQADQQLVKLFLPSTKATDGGRSTVRKMTEHAKVDA